MQKAPEQNVLYGAFMKNLGNYLLSHMKICSIIGEKELNFRVLHGHQEICKYIIKQGGRKFIFWKNKTHGLLVLVSSMPHGTSTSSLSTR